MVNWYTVLSAILYSETGSGFPGIWFFLNQGHSLRKDKLFSCKIGYDSQSDSSGTEWSPLKVWPLP